GGSMLALASGTLPRLMVSAWGGLLGSVARLVITSCVPTVMVWLAMAARTGGLLSGRTTTEKLWVALSDGWPLSATITLKRLVPTGPERGVQGKKGIAGRGAAVGKNPLPQAR